MGLVKVVCVLFEVRCYFVCYLDDYGIVLLDWLRECIVNVLFGIGQSCFIDVEVLLVLVFDFGFQFYEGQFRVSGDLYIVYLVVVVDLLWDIGVSVLVIVVGFFYDVVEDIDVIFDQIELYFGFEVCELVEGVIKFGGIYFNDCMEVQVENLCRMFLVMVSNICVVLVKLVDCLYNMCILGVLKEEKCQWIVCEICEIYVFFVNCFGIGCFKWELEDLVFKLLELEVFWEIQEEVVIKCSEWE